MAMNNALSCDLSQEDRIWMDFEERWRKNGERNGNLCLKS